MFFQVVVMAPIFGFFGKVDTKVWYSLILLALLIAHICIGAHVFKVLETGNNKLRDFSLQGYVFTIFEFAVGLGQFTPE